MILSSIAATRKISGVSPIGNFICIDYVGSGAPPKANVSQLLKAFADRLDLLFVCSHRKVQLRWPAAHHVRVKARLRARAVWGAQGACTLDWPTCKIRLHVDGSPGHLHAGLDQHAGVLVVARLAVIARAPCLESWALQRVQTCVARLEIRRGVHWVLLVSEALRFNATRLDLAIAKFHYLVHQLAPVLNLARTTLGLRHSASFPVASKAHSSDRRKFASIHVLRSCMDHIEATLDRGCESRRADLIYHLFRFSFVHVSLFVRFVWKYWVVLQRPVLLDCLLERLLDRRGGTLPKWQPLNVLAWCLLGNTSAQSSLTIDAVHIKNVSLSLISAPNQMALKQRVLIS